MKKFILTKAAKAVGVISALAAPLAARAVTVQTYSLGGLGTTNPEDVTVSIVNWILGILSLLAVIFILIGGFMWMTAAGNEEKIEKAKKILTAAIIGLIIILAAWGISLYAISTFTEATT